MDDWVTMWSAIMAIVSFFMAIVSVVLIPQVKDFFVLMLSISGSFCFGRITATIQPKRQRRIKKR